MNFPQQPTDREVGWILSNRLAKVCENVCVSFARTRSGWTHNFFPGVILLGFLVTTACDRGPQPGAPPPTRSMEEAETARAPEPASPPAVASDVPVAEAVRAEVSPPPLGDPWTIERHFLASQGDSARRLELVRQLADAEPAAVLTVLNRLFPRERREDVKMEMLTVLGDLDHSVEPERQWTLCNQALAPTQPSKVRYVAVHVLADLEDARRPALLRNLSADPDAQIRAAAAQVLRDLEE